jgi:hypothetical protein
MQFFPSWMEAADAADKIRLKRNRREGPKRPAGIPFNPTKKNNPNK